MKYSGIDLHSNRQQWVVVSGEKRPGVLVFGGGGCRTMRGLGARRYLLALPWQAHRREVGSGWWVLNRRTTWYCGWWICAARRRVTGAILSCLANTAAHSNATRGTQAERRDEDDAAYFFGESLLRLGIFLCRAVLYLSPPDKKSTFGPCGIWRANGANRPAGEDPQPRSCRGGNMSVSRETRGLGCRHYEHGAAMNGRQRREGLDFKNAGRWSRRMCAMCR